MVQTRSLINLLLAASPVMADVTIGGRGVTCSEDPACINRIHPGIPMAARARPGEKVVMIGRDAGDMELDPDIFASGSKSPRLSFGVVHPLTGPVHIETAKAGDVIAVTTEEINPGPVGWTSASAFGFAGATVGSVDRFIVWRLDDDFATSEDLPGVRTPNASFPGAITTMPGRAAHSHPRSADSAYKRPYVRRRVR